MATDPNSVTADTSPALRNPWLFVPLLYFMQAMPVTLVQEVSSVFYKDMGIADGNIAKWTSLIAIPWSLQMLLGPLVESTGTKRSWIIRGQFLIALGIVATAFILQLPYAFEFSLVVLGVTAICSALCNIATDGFYIAVMSRENQAKFVGVQTSFYRFGRLFCTGLLVLFVGLLTRFEPLPVSPTQGQLITLKPATAASVTSGTNTFAKDVQIELKGGKLKDQLTGLPILSWTRPAKDPTGPLGWFEVEAPGGMYGLAVDGRGQMTARTVSGDKELGTLFNANLPQQILSPVESHGAVRPIAAWTIILVIAGLIYSMGYIVGRKLTPESAQDVPVSEPAQGDLARNVERTLLLVGLGVGGFFMVNSITRLVLHSIWKFSGADVAGKFKGWMLPSPNTIIGFDPLQNPIFNEALQLGICTAIVVLAMIRSRMVLKGTAMAESFSSFVRQPGFAAIFGFILFYRFGEAMVSRMSPLFLKGTLAEGGMAIPNEQLGLIKGVAGVAGIIVGGIIGGMFISRVGIKKALWPLAIIMHLPNLLYLWASIAKPAVGLLYVVDFVDQFGYGFGYAGYSVYLMWVAQRGQFKTSHYAIGTGMGALGIAVGGALSGVLRENYGYTGFFIGAIICTVPGMLTLLFIPLEEPPTPMLPDQTPETP